MSDVVAGFTQIDFTSDFNINSLTFLIFAFFSVLITRLSHGHRLQPYCIVCLNIVFIALTASYVKDIAFVLGILITIYSISKAEVMIKNNVGLYYLCSVIVLWSFLFLCKDPDLFPAFNPFFFFPFKILGLSYLVFRGLSYLFEKNLNPRLHGFLHFTSYMLFFPTLISGPIERFSKFSKEYDAQNIMSVEIVHQSIHRILNGLIKKFVLADNLMAFGVFSLSQDPEISHIMLWIGAFCMLFLIYLDFSGYCDIMIGIARLMGFNLVENFNYPFISKNIQEFWTRWHISLGSIIQDYIFTPINKFVVIHLPKKWHFLMITFCYLISMILVAMWHGTTLGFLIFGICHGAVLILFQIKRKFLKKSLSLSSTRLSIITLYSSRLLTYAFVSFSLILWYGSLPMAIQTYKKLLGLS